MTGQDTPVGRDGQAPRPRSPDGGRRLEARTVAEELGKLRKADDLDARYLRQCETLRDALEKAGAPDHSLTFPMALGALYPDARPETVVDAFRTWRSRLNGKLREAGEPFQLMASRNRRLPLAERRCWFEDTDPTSKRVREYTAAQTRLDEDQVSTRGIFTVRYFVSYAHKDQADVHRLMEQLESRLARVRDYDFECLLDIDGLVPGERIESGVRKMIDSCHFGLQMISIHYMNSDFIRDHERPLLTSPEEGHGEKRVGFPIALDKIDIKGPYDWKEFGSRLVFHHRKRGYRYLDGEIRDAFVDGCVGQILQTVTRYLTGKNLPSTETRSVGQSHEHYGTRSDEAAPSEEFDPACLGEMASKNLPKYTVPTLGRPTPLDVTLDRNGPQPEAEGTDVLEHLLQWATGRRSTPLFALLGEYGTGKTVNCKRLAKALLQRRMTAPPGDLPPLPVYLDMRYAMPLSGSGAPERDGGRFDHVRLDGLVNAIFEESFRSDRKPDATDLRRLVRQGNVLLIFDGFDEVAARLHPDEAQSLFRAMWSLLPQEAFSPDTGRRPKDTEAVQMLVSCRTHYFRDMAAQAGLFTGGQREFERGHELYDSMVLLPFTEAQIGRYLAIHLGDGDRVRRALETIRGVNDLADLARRPVLLARIHDRLGEIEAIAARGQRINAARLYGVFVDGWLARDYPKHIFDVTSKKTLMARLSAAMWRGGERDWPVDRVEEWLDAELRGDPRLRDIYAEGYRGTAREILHKDLRTSTFVVRIDHDGFSFAHTSVQEYFLATHLFQTMGEGEASAWEGITPSRECLDFLAEIACENAREGERKDFFHWLGTLLRDRFHPGVSELALEVALEAQRRGEPLAPRGRYRLEGATLTDLDTARRDGDDPIDLSGSDFRGARLVRLRIANLTARDCAFDGAKMDSVSFENVDLSDGSFEGVRALSGRFRQCRMQGFRVSGAIWRGTEFIHCRDLPEPEATGDGPIVVPGEPVNDLFVGTADRDRPRLVTRFGHAGQVTVCAFNPDGSQVVSGNDIGTLWLRDADTGETVTILEGHRGRVTACAFSPDGSRVISGSYDRTLRVWDTGTGENVTVLEGHRGRVTACAFSPDGSQIVSGSGDGTLRLWDAGTYENVNILIDHWESIMACAFSPDGSQIVSGNDFGTLRVWDTGTGENVNILEGHRRQITACAFSSDGSRVISGCDDGTLRLRETVTGENINTMKGHMKAVKTCAFSSDGSQVISGSNDGTLRLWDGAGNPIMILESRRERIWTCAFSPDGSHVISGGLDGTLLRRDTLSGEAVNVMEGQKGRVTACAFSSDGSHIFSGGTDGTLWLWDAGTYENVNALTGHKGWITDCAFNTDGSRVVSGSGDGTLRLWDAISGETVNVMEGHKGPVMSCAFSPDGSRIVSGGLDGTLRLWDAGTGETVRIMKGHKRWIADCAFNTDGSHIFSGGTDGTLWLWETKSGKSRRILPEGDRLGSLWTCAFSPDGSLAVFGDLDGTLRLWDAISGKSRTLIDGERMESLWTCAFSPDGSLFVSGGSHGTLRLWDAISGKTVKVLEGHKGIVKTCAFSLDGSRVVSGSEDGTLRLWDAETGETVAVFHHLPDGGFLTCDSRESRVISASGDAWRHFRWFVPGRKPYPSLPLEADPRIGAIPKEGYRAVP